MASSAPANGLPRPQGESLPPVPLTNHNESTTGIGIIFAKWKNLCTDLEQSYLQHSDTTNPAEQLLQQELEKQKSMRIAEFSKSRGTRKAIFDQVEAAELQKFNDFQAQRKSEFEQNKRQREEMRSRQASQAELTKLKRQEEDAEFEYETSRLQQKQEFKIAQRRREDFSRETEAKHTSTHHEAIRQLQTEFDSKRQTLENAHTAEWREKNWEAKAQIERVQAALWLKLFGSSCAGNASKMMFTTPNTDIPTPPPDLSTGLDQQTRHTSMNPDPSHQRQATSVSTMDGNPSNIDESMLGNANLETDSNAPHPETQREGNQTSVSLSQLPQKELNHKQPSSLRGQDECEIQAVQNTLEALGEKCVRKNFWQEVVNQMEKKGYNLGAQSAAVLWSQRLRQECKIRGYAWADRVMKTAPYKTVRKRRTLSAGNELMPAAASSSGSRPLKRAKSSLGHQDTIDIHSNSARTQYHTSQLKSFSGRPIWQGAAFDVTELDWSPDGNRFLAGSMAIEDPIEQNEPYNLVLGSISSKTLREMPNTHRTLAGSTHQAAVLEKHLYRSVTAAQFSGSGDHAVTAGYDGYVRIWDLHQDPQPQCIGKLKHKRKVLVMAQSKQTNLLATGIEFGPEALQIWSISNDFSRFTSVEKPFHKVMDPKESPMCLAFGNSQGVQNWLVAGFGWDEPIRYGDGRLCVCSIDQSGLTERNFKPDHAQVFDVAWFPSGKGFVAGTYSHVPRSGERTCVQIYDINQRDSDLKVSCPAADMNMVTISPYQEEIVAASCTDGNVYVWDIRNPKQLLHTLAHEGSFRSFPGEEIGVRMTEWTDATALFSGASDGILKRWDLRLAPENVLVEDVYECGSEIMSGRFCPDKSALLLGDADESLHLLRKNNTGTQTLIEEFTFIEINGRDHMRNSSDVAVKQERSSMLRTSRESSLFNGSPAYSPPDHFPSVI